MEITEVRVRLLTDPNDRLKAVCTITMDEQFVIRDMKIVEGTHGLFVAMPSRKLSAGCPKCRCQNHLRAKHCNECGTKLPSVPIPMDDNGREKAHRDVAHPITAAVREMLQDKVLKAYEAELENEGRESETTSVSKVEDEHDASVEAPKEPIGFAREEPSVEPACAQAQEEPAFGSGFPSEPEEEPAVEPPSPVGEYNSLIADLKGGSKRRTNNREEKKPSSDDRGPRKRRRGSRGDGRDEDSKRDDAKPRESTPEVPVASAPEELSVIEEPRPAEREPKPVIAIPPAPVLDESGGFGAGLDEQVEATPVIAQVPPTEQPRREIESRIETSDPQGQSVASPSDTANTPEVYHAEESTNNDGFGAGIL